MTKTVTSSAPQVSVARQPILDRSKNVIGYELLFRPSAEHESRKMTALDFESAKVISGALGTIGLDTLTDGRKAFVSVSRRLLLDGIPSVLPPAQVVIELGSDIEADAEVVAACAQLRSSGYSIAVDDFVLNEWTAGLIPVANYLKVDCSGSLDTEARTRIAQSRQPGGPALIATGIETLDQFELAGSEGYTYFQGFFFGRPLITQAREIPGHQLAHLRLLQALNNPNLSVQQLEELVKHDASLCYRLLRTVNSAAFALQTPVQSIKQALIYLGRDTVRRWVSLWALAGMNERAHSELVIMSTVRARSAELLGATVGGEDGGNEGFLLGMCSLLDVILERPMASLLKELPLAEPAKAALRGDDNAQRHLLDCVIAYEHGAWERADAMARQCRIDPLRLPKAYGDALRWTREMQMGFSANAA
jgi:c-di-GMP-related signal transduction protein